MKNGIKIAIIAIVAIILIVAIVFSIKDLSGGADKVMATTPFEKTVEAKVAEQIEGKDYSAARSGFDAIMNYIDTETSITLADGKKNVAPEEAANAKAMVFNAYAPLVINKGAEIFARTSWSDSELNQLSSEASRLAGIGTDANLNSQLSNIVNIVTTYKQAWGVVTSAKNCSSISNISTLAAKAENYKRDPLTNNASLMAALKDVPATAKNAVASSLCSQAAALKNKYSSYSSWSSFLTKYNTLSNTLDTYVNSYGSNSKISQAYSYLSTAYDWAYSYFNSYYEYDYYDY